MTKSLRLGLLLGLAGFLAVTTGCAKKASTQTRINALEAQVNVMTDELARIDQQLQESRGGSLGAAPSQAGFEPSGAGGAGIYRTPSGFQLPSVEIQQALRNAGYYQGTIDGKIGPATRTAVKAFQRDHDLGADGVVGRRTWDKLKVYLSGAR